jgi:predicted exporter
LQLWKRLVGLSRRYAQGVNAIRPALFNCLLTCLAAAVANLAYEGWGHDALMSLTRRILVGYLGAACMVVLVLPWLQKREDKTEPDAPFDIGRIFGRGSGIHQGVEE